MFLEEAIYSRLGPLVGDRLFPGVAPADTAPPYLIYATTGGPLDQTLGGFDPASPVAVQVTIWAADHLGALQTAKAVFDELTRGDGIGFECSGVQRLGEQWDAGLVGLAWEFTLKPLE